MLLAQGASAAFQAGYFVLVARALGATGLGAVAAALAVIAAVMPFAGFGSGNVMIMRVARNPSLLRECWGNSLVVTAVGGAVLLLGTSAVVGVFFGAIPLELFVLLGIAEFFFVRVASTAAQAFQGVERMRATALIAALPSALRFAASIAFTFVAADATPEAWAMWYLAASVVAAALAALSVTIALGWPLAALRRARKDLRDGAYFSASLAATTIYTDIDKVMLAQLATLAAAGVYSAAYRVIGLAFLPVASLLLAAYPRFFKHGTAGIESSSRYAKRLLTVSLPLGFGAGLVVFVGAPLIPRVLGNEFASAVSIVRWLAVVPALQAAYYLGADALTGANLQRARTAIQVGTAGANVGLNLWLIPAYGARGAAWSTIASYAFLAIAVWIAVAAATQRSRERRRAPDARPGLARG